MATGQEHDVEFVEMSMSHNYNKSYVDPELSFEGLKRKYSHKYITDYQATMELLKSAIPSIASMIARRGVESLSFVFIGHLNDSNLIAGIGLASTTCTWFWFAMSLGLSTAIETLASPAFGSHNNYLAGWYYNRAQIIISVLFVFQAILLWNAESILLAIGQPKESAYYGGLYIKWYLPGLYMLCQIEMIRRFLMSQGIFNIMMNVQVTTFFTHLVCCSILILYFDLGLYGIAISANITNTLTFAIPAIYITVKKGVVRENSWHWINSDSFKGLIEYLRYGIPAMFMICLQFFCFELLTILAGYLGTDEQGAWIIIFSFSALFYMFAIGINFAVSSLVGNALGANNPNLALQYAKASIKVVIMFSLISIIILFVFREQIPKAFTSHEQIAQIVEDVMPVIWLLFVPDFIQGASAGIITAMGYQHFGSYWCLFSYWVISVPVSILLTFYFDMGVKGIWLGPTFGVTFISIAYLYIIFTTNWEKLAFEISERVTKESKTLKHQNHDSLLES